MASRIYGITPAQEWLLSIIDQALLDLHKVREPHYQLVNQRYNDQKAAITGRPGDYHLSFEGYIAADLRANLERVLSPNAVFMEFPGEGAEMIDLFVEVEKNTSGNAKGFVRDVAAYLELKMYYNVVEDHYRHDFDKVFRLVDFESSVESNTFGVLIHYEFHQNSNRPAKNLYEGFAEELEDRGNGEYWFSIKDLASIEAAKSPFLRFAFGKKLGDSPT